MKHRKTKNRKLRLVLLSLEILAILGLGILVWQLQVRDSRSEVSDFDWAELDAYYTESISHGGTDYPVRQNLSSVLLMGTDNFDGDTKQNKFEAFFNKNCADFLVVLVFDHDAKTVTPFQINRDTMCDVPWLSVNGLVGGTVYEQVTLSHTFGSGKDDSAKNTLNTVTALLYGAPVKHYFAFTMDAVPIINDLVGGVTVTLEENLPSLGDEYVQGASILLKGQAALHFVRCRDIEVLESNAARMARHRQYLEGFTTAARAAAAKNADLAIDAYRAIEKFIVTDLTAEAVSGMVENLCEYEILPVVTPDGHYEEGEFAEFYPDASSLWECVYNTWCRSES